MSRPRATGARCACGTATWMGSAARPTRSMVSSTAHRSRRPRRARGPRRAGAGGIWIMSARGSTLPLTEPPAAPPRPACTSFVDAPGRFGAHVEAVADRVGIVREHRLQVEGAIAGAVFEIARDGLPGPEYLVAQHVFLPGLRANIRAVKLAHRIGR